MTFREPLLKLNRLVVLYKSSKAYDERFHSGVNIIRGRNSSGKSSIVDFIFYALGGEFTNWKPEAERCDVVMAEVSINDQVLTLRRAVTTSKAQPMEIYTGDMEAALSSPFTDWKSYPAHRSEKKESFSQVLFRHLGYPEVTGEKGSNITMHQLLRLICVDQLSGVQSLFRDEAFDSPLTRRTVGDLLLGVYDDRLYDDQLELRTVEQQQQSEKVEVEGLESALKHVGQYDDLVAVDSLANETEKQLLMVREMLAKGMPVQSADSGQSTAALKSAEKTINEQKLLYSKTATSANVLSHEIEDSESFVENLLLRLAAIKDSIEAEQALGHLALQLCPECLQPLSHDALAGHCHLCKQETPDTGRSNRILKLKNELANQIDESRRLLKIKQERLQVFKRELIDIGNNLVVAQRNLDDVIGTARSSRDAQYDELLVRKGALEAKLSALQQQKKLALRLNELKNSIKALKRRIEDLQQNIEAGLQRQSTRKIEALNAIEKYTLKFLKADLQRELEFKVAQNVEANFEKNICLVDGRSNFSASSMAYLKGAVHFALFFASLELDFLRYPKLIINDNIEDKGMEEVRSKNFQQVLVAISKKFDVEHQIIIATSMIDDSLDRDEYTVGERYSETNKTLKIPPAIILPDDL